MVRDDPSRPHVLPFVLLGQRPAVRKEFDASSAHLVYGKNLRLPGHVVLDRKGSLGASGLLGLLEEVVAKLKPPLLSALTRAPIQGSGIWTSVS